MSRLLSWSTFDRVCYPVWVYRRDSTHRMLLVFCALLFIVTGYTVGVRPKGKFRGGKPRTPVAAESSGTRGPEADGTKTIA